MSTHDPGRTSLYRYFNTGRLLLYVGISDKPDVRWGQHRRTKPWAPQVAERVVEWFPTRAEAAAAELVAIRTERPVYNHMGTSKIFTKRTDPTALAQRYCGAAEIARAFGIGRQRIQVLTSRRDFPAPAVRLAMGKVWETDDVRRWAERHGRRMNEIESGESEADKAEP